MHLQTIFHIFKKVIQLETVEYTVPWSDKKDINGFLRIVKLSVCSASDMNGVTAGRESVVKTADLFPKIFFTQSRRSSPSHHAILAAVC